MSISRHRNAEQNRNIKTAGEFFENATKFKDVRMTIRKSKLRSRRNED